MAHSRILVVEDEQLVAQDLQETLESLGYCVAATVATGEEALRQLEASMPDLVLMDIRLSGAIDGIQTSEQIQSRFRVPIVYLTASTDRLTLERVKATHPFGYILKPFDSHTLLTTIEIALARYQAELEALQKAAIASLSDRSPAWQACEENSTRLLSMIAHEFRNPLTTIRFTADLLQRHQQLPDEKRQHHLHRLHAATGMLDRLLEDLLMLGRSNHQQVRPVTHPINLTAFCQDYLETFQCAARSHYKIHFSAAATALTVNLDEKLLWHLLNNLLSNAVKYSPIGSNIWLTVSASDQQIFLSVRDEGIGIPPEAQDSLFEPFYRASNVGEVAGTGLGLAIAKHCVDLHGGTLSVDSLPGRGSTFTVALPRTL